MQVRRMEGLRKDDLGVYQLALPLQDSPQGKHATHFSHQPRYKRWHVVGEQKHRYQISYTQSDLPSFLSLPHCSLGSLGDDSLSPRDFMVGSAGYFIFTNLQTRASLVVQLVKNLPALWETWV